MQNFVRGAVLVAIVGAAAFWVVVGSAPDKKELPPREVEIFEIEDLRSNIAGQPASTPSGVIIYAPRGHTEGHIVSTEPRILPHGEYRFEIDADFGIGRRPDTAVCVMDLLVNSILIANRNVDKLDENEFSHPGMTFQSPAASGANTFQMRVYCNGGANVVVRSVKLIKNPSTPPRIIIQR